MVANDILEGVPSMTLWIAIAVGVLVALWLITTYNGLVALKNQTGNAWRQIDVQLKRRHDLIPNLVNTVKGFMKYEEETLIKVVEARNAAMGAQGVAEASQAEMALTQSLGKLFALTEAYPDLKSNENVLQLQEELTGTENKIAFARQHYNDLVMRFNTAQGQFPTNVIAGLLGFKQSTFFEVEQAARETPRVNLSLS
jgi:LemA protein